MFELKLKTGTTLKVDGIEERYTNRGTTEQNVLTIRINSGAVDLETVRNALNAEGAIKEIVVTDETGLETSFTSYNLVQSIVRTLVPGGANIVISLGVEIEVEE